MKEELVKFFDPSHWYDYQPIKTILSQNEYLLFAPSNNGEITSQDLIDHIAKSEAENKIAIFYNLKLNDVNISHQKIYVPLMFISCAFKNICKLTDNSYFYPVIFHSTIFNQLSKFKLSLFYNGVAFIDSIFKEEVSFEKVKFLANSIKYLKRELTHLEICFPSAFNVNNMVDFLGVKFFKDVTFANANVGCSILFANYKNHHTSFHGECDFACNFEETENIILNDTDEIFQNQEIVIKLDSFHHIAFLGVTFHGDLTFENRKFEKKTIFKEVIFEKAPKFHNCNLHQDTDFQGSEFRDTFTEGAERAYRSLKLMMNNKSAGRESGMFFSLEQRSLLNTPLKKYNNRFIDFIRFKINSWIVRSVFKAHSNNKLVVANYTDTMIDEHEHHAGFYLSLTEKLISYLYLILSNYSQNIQKPLLILSFFSFVIFPLFYILIYSKQIADIQAWGEALHISLQQLFKPFEVYSSRYNHSKQDLSFVFYLTTTVQSMFNIGLITLFVLAIRARFKVF
jgi:hypothetical protein